MARKKKQPNIVLTSKRLMRAFPLIFDNRCHGTRELIVRIDYIETELGFKMVTVARRYKRRGLEYQEYYGSKEGLGHTPATDIMSPREEKKYKEMMRRVGI